MKILCKNLTDIYKVKHFYLNILVSGSEWFPLLSHTQQLTERCTCNFSGHSPFLNMEFSFAILHWSGNRDSLIDEFTRLFRGNAMTSALSFKNFEDIPSKPAAFDESRQAKIFWIVSSVALHSSKLWQLFSVFM